MKKIQHYKASLVKPKSNLHLLFVLVATFFVVLPQSARGKVSNSFSVHDYKLRC